MAHSDDTVSRGGLLLEERPSRRTDPNRPAPHTDRWWLVEPPARTASRRSGRGPAHHPSRTQTHSDGLPLGHLFEPVTPPNGLHWPDRAVEADCEAEPGAPVGLGSALGGSERHAGPGPVPPQAPHHTPPNGRQVSADLRHGGPLAGQRAGATGHAVSTGHTGGFPTVQYGHTGRAPLPRRRDVRAGRVAPPLISAPSPTPGRALGGLAEPETTLLTPVPPAVPDGEVTPLDLVSGPLPRRRDLRAAEQAEQSRRALRAARKSALTDASRATGTATTVARGAVLTGLVAVGVVTITGQHLDLGSVTTTDATAELALKSAPPSVEPAPLFEVYPDADRAEWQVGTDARAEIVAGLAEVKAKQAAAKRAAARRAAEKAAAEARVAARAEALRNAQRNPRAIGRIMAAERGWTGSQWTCLDLLFTRESKWRWYADNPSSSAYGIAQALPGSRMASAGSDWRTNPVTQISWGLDYIATRYGSPCNAWSHSERTGWY